MAVANNLPGNLILRPAPPLVARAIQQQLRSGQSLRQSYVNFVNITKRTVNLYWIDYKGQATFYLLLRPLASAKVNTYRSHPWIFCDRKTSERMHVAHNRLFWPQPYHAPDPRQRGQWIPCRKQILIHFPVRTLRETCLWQLLQHLLSDSAVVSLPSIAPERVFRVSQAIDVLSLPLTVRTDLKALLTRLINHRLTPAGQPER